MASGTDWLRSVGLDRYDLNARLKPALLALLPCFTVVGYWFPAARTFSGVIISLVTTCGVTYLMAQTARRRGRAIEKKLSDRAGRRHSARLLTHADLTIAADTKARYHDFLRMKGLAISTSEEESDDATKAFERARSAVDWLLEHTKPSAKSSLLFEENIAYGFHRNLLGLKPLALGIAVIALVGHIALIALHAMTETELWSGALVGVVLVALVGLWTVLVSKAAVTDASLAYAQRLFSQCERTV